MKPSLSARVNEIEPPRLESACHVERAVDGPMDGHPGQLQTEAAIAYGA
jgi:hypothetical protein